MSLARPGALGSVRVERQLLRGEYALPSQRQVAIAIVDDGGCDRTERRVSRAWRRLALGNVKRKWTDRYDRVILRERCSKPLGTLVGQLDLLPSQPLTFGVDSELIAQPEHGCVVAQSRAEIHLRRTLWKQ